MAAEIRPRIKIISELSKKEVQQRISDYINSSDNYCKGWVKEGYAIVCASVNEKHIWTPQLSLQIDELENGTELRGVIGPGPSVWTGFIFAFSLLGFLLFVISMWGLINLSLNKDATILWLVPVDLLLIFLVYISARIGQSLSKKEVMYLHKFVETISKKNS